MAIDRFGVLADPTRRRVLAALARSGTEGRTAGDLARELGLGRSLVSYHLARLQAAGIASVETDVTDRRRRIYRLAHDAAPRPSVHRGPARQPRPALPPPVPPADVALGALAADSGIVPGGQQPLLGRGLPAATRERVGRYAQRRRASAGQILFTQGDPACGIWFVESGAVRLFTSDTDGREQTLQVVRPDASFNEVPFFDLGPEPATAQVLEDATLLVLPVGRRSEILGAAPELATAAAASFAFRLRQAIALVEDLSFRQVAGRVARVLLQAVLPHAGVGAGSGGRTLTQREIAEMVGSSREVVARALRQLEREGLIRVEQGRIVLLDREGLAARQ